MKTEPFKGKILRVRILNMIDPDPDTSMLGEYSDIRDGMVVATGEFVADVDRRLDILDRLRYADIPALETAWKARFDKLSIEWEDLNMIHRMCRRYRFLIPYAGGEPPGSKEYREYARADFKRLEEYVEGKWWYTGIRAEADIVLPGRLIVQTILSGDIYGIESDGDEAYKAEIKHEQLSILRQELQAVGFSQQQISEAFANCTDD